MNDRYLFRGKLINNGQWAYGNLSVKPNECYIITPDDTPIGQYGQVIAETVGQCTGLKDKNGKLIFEGDILLFTNDDGEKTPYKVCWSEKYAGYTIITNDGATDTMDYWDKWIEYYEILGNIHDNPELLEVEE